MSKSVTARLDAAAWRMLAHAHPELAAFPAQLRSAALELRARAGETLFRLGSRPRMMLFVSQ